ncbi:hypothetical protein IAU60_000952 [Kwoniella sp. DSM 27419]
MNAPGQTAQSGAEEKSFLQPPGWGSYLYQNFLLPALSPSATLDWIVNTPQPQNHNSNGNNTTNSTSSNSTNGNMIFPGDYFGLPKGLTWEADNSTQQSFKPDIKAEILDISVNPPQQQQQPPRQPYTVPMHQQQQPQAGPSCFYPQFYYPATTGINTSLLTQQYPQASIPPSISLADTQRESTDSVTLIDQTITRSPSPLSSNVVSPHASPALRSLRDKRGSKSRGKKRSHSFHSDSDLSHDDPDHDHDHEPEVPEGVERDGMIWGMKVEDYRALSARERKRVRNRISARTFRAKRKEHLSSLEHTLGAKDQLIKNANDEAARLRREVADLKKRLAKYEATY